MNKCALFFSLFFYFPAVALYLAAMLTNFWVSVGGESYGLLYVCNATADCMFVEWDLTQFANIVAPRIVMVVAGGIAAVAFFVGLSGIACKNGAPIVAEGAMYIVTGIVIFGGCATFTALASLDMSFSPIPFGYSFYLGWVSGLLFILSGIFTIVLGNTAFSSYFS